VLVASGALLLIAPLAIPAAAKTEGPVLLGGREMVGSCQAKVTTTYNMAYAYGTLTTTCVGLQARHSWVSANGLYGGVTSWSNPPDSDSHYTGSKPNSYLNQGQFRALNNWWYPTLKYTPSAYTINGY
jgi:hypothetical protein